MTWRNLVAPAVYGLAPTRPSPPRALSKEERETVRDLLNSTRFVDLCSMRNMYRLLAQANDATNLCICLTRDQVTRHRA